MFFTIENDLVNLSMDSESEPDVVITGSLLTLAGLIGAGGEQAIRDGKIDLTGDARLAQQFYELLCFARPDVEEELSSLVGDATAYRLGVFARRIGRWASAARTTIQSNIREYLLTDFDEKSLVEAIQRPTARWEISHTSEIPFNKYGMPLFSRKPI